LHVYSVFNVNYEVSAQMGQFYVALYRYPPVTFAANPRMDSRTPTRSQCGLPTGREIVAPDSCGIPEEVKAMHSFGAGIVPPKPDDYEHWARG